MRVIPAGQVPIAGQSESAWVGVVAALYCCTENVCVDA
jgi:hypothetical protein